MCNCGKKRSSFNTQQQNVSGNIQQVPAQHTVYTNFEYTGKTGLTVVGNFTGRKYRFNYTGDVQPVDKRDEAGMTGVPVLRKK